MDFKFQFKCVFSGNNVVLKKSYAELPGASLSACKAACTITLALAELTGRMSGQLQFITLWQIETKCESKHSLLLYLICRELA